MQELAQQKWTILAHELWGKVYVYSPSLFLL